MAVTLAPEIRYRSTVARYLRENGGTEDMLAERLGVSPGMVTSYLTAEIVPDPQTFLRLRSLLGVPGRDPRGLDSFYVQLLARAQKKARRRTSSIQSRHVPLTGVPDPLVAESAEEVMAKLRDVYEWALRPSYRELQERSGDLLKRSTIGDLLRADRKVLPRFDRYARFLEVCGVRDLTYWVAAWRKFAPPSDVRGHWMAQAAEEQLRAEIR
ncbi:helix-turn-helix domain-containing protein [Streptomyces sp. NPDC008125]|uniref:helix-turn-helix domain-containing protein n=1 Tax=Streptomyces sp. NPDC008125 TaxID=3364811 RepID=UPI0036E9C483